MTNEQIQALKSLCVKAGGEEWVAFVHSPSSTCSVHTPGDERCGDVIKWAGFDGQKNAKAKAKFIAAANPAAILSLLAEHEADKALIAELKKIAEHAQRDSSLVEQAVTHIDEQNKRIAELKSICAESYQVVGVMADSLGVFNDIKTIKALDNLSEQKLVHADVLPFSVEARTLTVKLPERCECCYSEQEAALFDGVVEECTEALESACAAAGITLKVGGE